MPLQVCDPYKETVSLLQWQITMIKLKKNILEGHPTIFTKAAFHPDPFYPFSKDPFEFAGYKEYRSTSFAAGRKMSNAIDRLVNMDSVDDLRHIAQERYRILQQEEQANLSSEIQHLENEIKKNNELRKTAIDMIAEEDSRNRLEQGLLPVNISSFRKNLCELICCTEGSIKRHGSRLRVSAKKCV